MNRWHWLSRMMVFSLLSSATVWGAEVYYVKDEGGQWQTADGKPVIGARKATTLICKQGQGCYALIFAGRQLGAWRQRGEMWEEVQYARQKLEDAEAGTQVELDPEIGRALFISAQQGYLRSESESR